MQGAYLPVEISIRIEIRIEIQPLALAWKDSEHPMQRSCCPMAAAPAARRGQLKFGRVPVPFSKGGRVARRSERNSPCRQIVMLPASVRSSADRKNPAPQRCPRQGAILLQKRSFCERVYCATLEKSSRMC